MESGLAYAQSFTDIAILPLSGRKDLPAELPETGVPGPAFFNSGLNIAFLGSGAGGPKNGRVIAKAKGVHFHGGEDYPRTVAKIEQGRGHHRKENPVIPIRNHFANANIRMFPDRNLEHFIKDFLPFLLVGFKVVNFRRTKRRIDNSSPIGQLQMQWKVAFSKQIEVPNKSNHAIERIRLGPIQLGANLPAYSRYFLP